MFLNRRRDAAHECTAYFTLTFQPQGDFSCEYFFQVDIGRVKMLRVDRLEMYEAVKKKK